ncbi:MAG: hypothetical protein IJZ13_08630 [Clostridia bacterium]|nr:hypothetical protein [Clostridia bacterium]
MKNTMRRLLPLLLAALLLLSMAACANDTPESSEAGNESVAESESSTAEESVGDTDTENSNGEASVEDPAATTTGSDVSGGDVTTTVAGDNATTTKKGDKSTTKNSTTATSAKITDTVIDKEGDLGVDVPKGEYDFGGKDIVIAVWTDKVQPELGESAAEDARYYALKYAMQKYNIGSIQYKQYSNGAEAYNTTFVKYAASGDFFADVMTTMSWYIDAYVQQDLVQDLTPHLSKLESKYFATNVASVGTGNYGFQSVSGDITLREAYLIYNTDLIKANNLTDPQQVWKNGEWDLDTYRDYCRQITDVNRDIYGMAIGNFHQLFNDPSNSAIYWDATAKKYKSAWLGGDKERLDRINKTYQFIFDLYNDGSVLGDFLIGQQALDQGRDAFRNGKIGFLFGTNDLCAIFKSEGMKNFSVVAAPTADGSHSYWNSSAHYSFYTLPSKNQRYEAAQMLAVVNDMFRTSDPSRGKAYYMRDEAEVVEDLHADYFLTKKDAQFIVELGKCTKTNYPVGIFAKESFQVAREMVQPVLQGKKTWANVIGQYGPVHQKDLDDSLNSVYD